MKKNESADLTIVKKSKNSGEKSSEKNLQPIRFETLKSIYLNFYNELLKAKAGKKSSIPYIHHPTPAATLVKFNKKFQIMVIGGSVFKKALVKNNKGIINILEKRQDKLPIFRTKEDLLYFVEQNLDPTVEVVSLNFAQPLKPVFVKKKLDGILITGAKEHTLTGLIDEHVGLTLEKYFWEKYKRKISITVANDTICVLLSGLEKASRDCLAGGVVGTGVNFAFFEDDHTIVNLESRNFNKFPISEEAYEISLISDPPGVGLFGKETSGAYLYQQYNYIIRKRSLPYPHINSTKELNSLATQRDSEYSRIAKGLIQKSASLVAVQIAGITRLKGHDMTFVMEGSLFWKADNYKEQVEGFLKLLIPDFKVNFVSIHDGYFLGAAKLAC